MKINKNDFRFALPYLVACLASVVLVLYNPNAGYFRNVGAVLAKGLNFEMGLWLVTSAIFLGVGLTVGRRASDKDDLGFISRPIFAYLGNVVAFLILLALNQVLIGLTTSLPG